MMEGEGEFIEDPMKDLLGKRLDFLIKIENGKLPQDFSRETFVEYALMNEENKFDSFRTTVMIGKNVSPNYNYSKHHTYLRVHEKLLDYLMNSNVTYLSLELMICGFFFKITFYVYGYEDKLVTRTNSVE